MRIMIAAALAAMLLACDENRSTPTQPEGTASVAIGSGSDQIEAATTAEDQPIRGFFATGLPGGVSVNIGTSFTAVQSLSLPAGKYIATGSAVLASNAFERRYVDCIFLVNGLVKGDLSKGMIGGTGRDDFTSLPLTIGFSINAPTNLVLGCSSDVADVVLSQTSHITAIRVERLTIQQP